MAAYIYIHRSVTDELTKDHIDAINYDVPLIGTLKMKNGGNYLLFMYSGYTQPIIDLCAVGR